jgi:hypothetical protein
VPLPFYSRDAFCVGHDPARSTPSGGYLNRSAAMPAAVERNREQSIQLLSHLVFWPATFMPTALSILPAFS